MEVRRIKTYRPVLPIDVASTNVGRVPFRRSRPGCAAMVHSLIKSSVVFGLSPNTANGLYVTVSGEQTVNRDR